MRLPPGYEFSVDDLLLGRGTGEDAEVWMSVRTEAGDLRVITSGLGGADAEDTWTTRAEVADVGPVRLDGVRVPCHLQVGECVSHHMSALLQDAESGSNYVVWATGADLRGFWLGGDAPTPLAELPCPVAGEGGCGLPVSPIFADGQWSRGVVQVMRIQVPGRRDLLLVAQGSGGDFDGPGPKGTIYEFRRAGEHPVPIARVELPGADSGLEGGNRIIQASLDPVARRLVYITRFRDGGLNDLVEIPLGPCLYRPGALCQPDVVRRISNYAPFLESWVNYLLSARPAGGFLLFRTAWSLRDGAEELVLKLERLSGGTVPEARTLRRFPRVVQGNAYGNIGMALSRVLYEEVMFDPDEVTSIDWESYPIAESPDTPEAIDVVLINRPDKPAMGAGEPSTRPVSGAIANAFYDATGVRMRTAPMTPARVKAALRKG